MNRTSAKPSDAVASRIPLDAAGRVAVSIGCRRCGYDQRGLSPDGACPECGTPVGRSLHGDLLRFSDPVWVRRLASGLNWIAAAVVLRFTIGCLTGGAVGALAGAGATAGLTSMPLLLPHGLGILIGLGSLYGYWKATTPDPGRVESESGLTARRLVRLTQVLEFCVALLVAPAFVVGSMLVGIVVAASTFGTIISVVGIFAALTYARRLAMRIPDENLARATRIVMWGLGITFSLIALLSTTAGILTAGMRTPPTWIAPGTTSAPARPGATTMTIRVNVRGQSGPTTVPTALAPPRPPPWLAAAGLGMAVCGLATTVFGFWAIWLLFRYRSALRNAAQSAEQTWAAAPP